MLDGVAADGVAGVVDVGSGTGSTTTERLSNPRRPSGAQALVRLIYYAPRTGSSAAWAFLRPRVIRAGPRLGGHRPQARASSDRLRARQRIVPCRQSCRPEIQLAQAALHRFCADGGVARASGSMLLVRDISVMSKRSRCEQPESGFEKADSWTRPADSVMS